MASGGIKDVLEMTKDVGNEFFWLMIQEKMAEQQSLVEQVKQAFESVRIENARLKRELQAERARSAYGMTTYAPESCSKIQGAVSLLSYIHSYVVNLKFTWGIICYYNNMLHNMLLYTVVHKNRTLHSR